MSVNCRVTMNSNHQFHLNYICFGFTRGIANLGRYYFNDCSVVNDGKRVPMDRDQFLEQFNLSLRQSRNLKHIDYKIPYEEDSRRHKELYDHVKNFLEAFPMYNGCLSLHPKLGTVRATFKNNPADKAILGLMSVRNLAYPQRMHTYKWALEKGASVRVAFLFSDWFVLEHGNLGQITNVYINSDDESKITDVWTMGKSAVKSFLQQDENYNPWYQESFKKQNRYFRDCDYEDDDLVFNPLAPIPELDDYDDVVNHDELEGSGYSAYRKMVHCFSEPYDPREEELIEQVHTGLQNGVYVPIGYEDRFSIDQAERILEILTSIEKG